MYRRACLSVFVTVAAVAAAAVAPSPAAATSGVRHPRLLRVGQVAQQDIAPQPGSEPDTLVEPDVAVSPRNPAVAVAAAHDGRFPDGGAVDISYTWTHDGGRHWHHAPVPRLTKAVGGAWDRASDPVVAFGPDGSAYLSVLVFDNDCPSGVAVLRSVDGGRTFAAPVLVHQSQTCDVSDDKNWLVVDNGRFSRHRGRVYQFWTAFLTDADGNDAGSPQWLRWSDDHGRHWSSTVVVSAPHAPTQNSQVMIQPNGVLTDVYLQDPEGLGEGPEHEVTGFQAERAPAPAQEEIGEPMVARTSRDGGATWTADITVTKDVGEGPEGIRCCLPSAAADPITGEMYVVWNSVTPNQVRISRSRDGRHWSTPAVVNPGAGSTIETVNADVSAYRGAVFVAYGSRDTSVLDGRYVQQELAASYNGGRRFARPLAVGQRSDLRFAAIARGIFPGDYMGTAVTDGAVYLVWARSSTPADPAATFHQVIDGAVLRP